MMWPFFAVAAAVVWIETVATAAVTVGLSADIHEFWFQAAKRSDMDCAELQGFIFVD